MAACYCMRGSRKRIMEWGCLIGHWCLWWGEGGRGPIVVILLNFTMGNLSFSLEMCMQRNLFRIVEIIV